MLFLINTLLGFLLAQLLDILSRHKGSEDSPEKFSFKFFWQDTRIKIFVSLGISLTLSVLVYLNIVDLANLFGKDWNSGIVNIWYAIIGFCPEIVLQVLRKRFGLLQPKRD